LGIVHVLTGPDHMAAIATLACGGKLRSFYLGARWGLGHSAGILVVYTIFLLIPDFELESMGQTGDTVVGGLMICLGIFGFWRARTRYLAKLQASDGSSPLQSLMDGVSVPMYDPLPPSRDPEHQPKHEVDDTQSSGRPSSAGRTSPARSEDINMFPEQITPYFESGDLTAPAAPDFPPTSECTGGRAADQESNLDTIVDVNDEQAPTDADRGEGGRDQQKEPPRKSSLMRFADMLLGAPPSSSTAALLPHRTDRQTESHGMRGRGARSPGAERCVIIARDARIRVESL
jgi:hypothetical protein